MREKCETRAKLPQILTKLAFRHTHRSVLSSNRDRKEAANEAAAKKLGEDIRTTNLGKELIGSRIKMECWDSMEVQKKEVSHTATGNTSPVATYYIYIFSRAG